MPDDVEEERSEWRLSAYKPSNHGETNMRQTGSSICLLKLTLAGTALLLPGCQVASPAVSDPISAEVDVAPFVQAEQLLGTWDVSLYFSPTDPPSSTVLDVFEVREDGTLVGSFYQTPFEIARYTIRNEEILFTVITGDGSGPYSTSGRMGPDGIIHGQTLSHGRNFLMTWAAQRRAD